MALVVRHLKLPARVRIAVNNRQAVNGAQPLDHQVLGSMAVRKVLQRLGGEGLLPRRVKLIIRFARAVADARHAKVTTLRLGQLGGFERSVSGCERGVSKR